jgi:branched-chain amino acid transport system substrate-binding protein
MIMSKNGTRKSLILLLVLALSLLPACGPEKSKGEVVVYVAVPLSGFMANGGQTVLGGARLMADRLNREGGLLGYQVTVVGMDDESDSEVAVAVAQEIQQAVNEGKKVIGVVGHLNSGQTIEAMKVYKDLPLIVITPTSSEVSISQQGYRNFFRINANDTVQARIDAEFLVNTLGVRRVAVIYNDDPYGIGLAQLMAQNLQALGAEVPVSLQVAVEQSTFEKEIPQIRDAAPDAVFYAGYEIEAPYLRLSLVENGLGDLPFLASDGAFLSATIDEAGAAAEGIYVSAFGPSPSQAVDKNWVREYQAVEYRNPDTYSINGYSALAVLAEGVKQAKSLDAAKVADALRSLDTQTPIGRINFDANGDLKSPQIYIFLVQDADFVQIFPE